MKKTRLSVIIVLALALILPLGAAAFMAKADNSVFVAKNEVIDGNLYAAGNTITVEGTVDGDVICAGQTINITGKVAGDVICAGQTVNITGEVGGNVRVAGNSVSLSGAIGRNVNAAGASIYLGSDAVVGWDMLIAGAGADIRGRIDGELYGAAANVVLAGRVDGDVRLRLDERVTGGKQGLKTDSSESLELTKDAIIGGNIIYTAGRIAKIDDGARITGQITFNEPKAKPEKRNGGGFPFRLISFFAALVAGLVLVSLWGKPAEKITDGMAKNPAPAIAWGIAIMFLTPILAVILMVTLIGFPLALIMLALWMIAIYLAKIVAAIMFGRKLLIRFWPKHKESLIRAMIIGIALLWFVCWIPVIGWMVCLLAIWWGLGGLWLAARKA